MQKLPLLNTKAGPRDGEAWIERMKEEYMALIQVRIFSYNFGSSSACASRHHSCHLHRLFHLSACAVPKGEQGGGQ